jgi:hypothetical protein
MCIFCSDTVKSKLYAVSKSILNNFWHPYGAQEFNDGIYSKVI